MHRIASPTDLLGALSRIRPFLVPLAAALLLSACASVPPEEIEASEVPVTQGIYKVGTPYQVNNVWYYPAEDWDYDQTGMASWYGPKFHGRLTANGETFNMEGLTAAHPTLPMPTRVRVTNLSNGRSVVLRVNDRGPFARGRILDVSRRAAEILGFKEKGTAKVRVEMLGRAPLDLMHFEKPETPELERAAVAVPVETVQATAIPIPGGGTPRAVPAADAAPATQVSALASDAASAAPTASRLAAFEREVAPAEPGLYVQVGAFESRDNADRLHTRLLGAGLDGAKVVPHRQADRTLYRVRLGPVPDLDVANRYLTQVIRKGHQGAKIVSE